MARLTRAALVLGLAFSLAPAPAHATNPDVTGTINVATGTPASNGNARPIRCLYQFDKGTQGTFGWIIENITPDVVFTLTATTGTTDLDVDFFRKLTPCEADPDKAVPEHDNHTGNEHGNVPETATVAIITMRNGPPNAGFVYHEEPREDAP